MIFVKFCQQDPLQLSKWAQELSFVNEDSDAQYSFKDFLAPLMNRTDSFPLDRSTTLAIIGGSTRSYLQTLLHCFSRSKSKRRPLAVRKKNVVHDSHSEDDSHFEEEYLVDNNRATLQDFDIYRPHLLYLNKQLQDWRPQGFWDFFIAAYNDRLTWFSAVVALIFGLLGVLSVVSSVIQGVTSAMSVKLAMEAQQTQS